jgi:2-isopropylmalate synthase
MSKDQIYDVACSAIQRALRFTDDVEFSCEDATRTEIDFLVRMYQGAVDAGATTLNVPDTVGCMLPHRYGALLHTLRDSVKGSSLVWSIHTHNDLGLAVANALSGISAGARQVECTINGIGERAGNAAFEEVVQVISMYPSDFGGAYTNINRSEIYASSRTLVSITGVEPQTNKALVGASAFAHESGIHQHGVLADIRNYEHIDATEIGAPKGRLILGKHSGKAAFRNQLESLGILKYLGESDEQRFDNVVAITRACKKYADSGKEITAQILIQEAARLGPFQFLSFNKTGHEYEVFLSRNGEQVSRKVHGTGGKAIFNAIREMVGFAEAELEQYICESNEESGQNSTADIVVRITHGKQNVYVENKNNDIFDGPVITIMIAFNQLLLELETSI